MHRPYVRACFAFCLALWIGLNAAPAVALNDEGNALHSGFPSSPWFGHGSRFFVSEAPFFESGRTVVSAFSS
jgi:hypothetical protein